MWYISKLLLLLSYIQCVVYCMSSYILQSVILPFSSPSHSLYSSHHITGCAVKVLLMATIAAIACLLHLYLDDEKVLENDS